MNRNRQEKGITLIALVITVVVMLILAGVAINLTIGENGIFQKSKQGVGVHNKQEATEKVNLKITYTQMRVYTESQRMPTLQEIANDFCQDNEIEYVELASKRVASLENIEVGQSKSIFTKLKQYPYEFEINDSLQLASIDGVKLAQNEGNYEDLEKKIENLENAVKQKDSDIESLQNAMQQKEGQIENLETRLTKLENENIVGRKTKLTQDNFSVLEVIPSTASTVKNYGNIKLTDSIENYKYLEIQIESRQIVDNILWGEKTILVAIDNPKYYNNDVCPYTDWNKLKIYMLSNEFGSSLISMGFYLKNEKEIVIGTAIATNNQHSIRIKEIYGIK